MLVLVHLYLLYMYGYKLWLKIKEHKTVPLAPGIEFRLFDPVSKKILDPESKRTLNIE